MSTKVKVFFFNFAKYPVIWGYSFDCLNFINQLHELYERVKQQRA